MKTILKYLEKYYKRMTLGLVIKIVGTLFELLLPFILSYILGNIIGRRVREILFWGGIMILCSALACLCNMTANRMAAKVSCAFAESMRKDLFIKTLRLSAAQTDRFTIPSLESRITTDTYNVHNFINRMQRLGVRAPILLLGGIGFTLFMDAHLSLVMIALLPFLFISIFLVSRKGVPLYSKVQRSVDGMVRVVREDTQGIRVLKALSKTEYEHRRYDEVNKTLIRDETRAGVIMGSMNPIMNLFMNFGSVAVIALGAYRVSGGLSKPETIIAFMQYFTQISMAMMSLNRIFVMYTKCAASAGRIAEVLNTEEDVVIGSKEEFPDLCDSAPASLGGFSDQAADIAGADASNRLADAHIVFDNVSFSYKGKRNNLENISFSIPRGGSLGIIGATGSGKSTLIRLLLRFYDTGKGNIYINGENVRTIPKDKLYAMFGSALQADFLYADTIEENIRFGRDISKEDVVRAAEIAQAHTFITSFGEGYQHMLSPHGTNISGGQKQRVLISRALAAKPEILILDDSSSALDYKTDAALRWALAENMQDTTVVTVAQRVSSVKDCDLILVLNEGKIIGMGDHEHLLENCQEYREISDSQMGGAFVE